MAKNPLDQFLALLPKEVLSPGRAPGFKRDWPVSETFKNRVLQIANNVQTNPDWLMAVMDIESGLSPHAKNPTSSATGLIQWMGKNGNYYGLSRDQFAALPAEKQLDYVEKWFLPHKGKLNSPGAVYTAVAAPAYVNGQTDPNKIIYAAGSREARANPMWQDSSGNVTLGKLNALVENRIGNKSNQSAPSEMARGIAGVMGATPLGALAQAAMGGVPQPGVPAAPIPTSPTTAENLAQQAQTMVAQPPNLPPIDYSKFKTPDFSAMPAIADYTGAPVPIPTSPEFNTSQSDFTKLLQDRLDAIQAFNLPEPVAPQINTVFDTQGHQAANQAFLNALPTPFTPIPQASIVDNALGFGMGLVPGLTANTARFDNIPVQQQGAANLGQFAGSAAANLLPWLAGPEVGIPANAAYSGVYEANRQLQNQGEVYNPLAVGGQAALGGLTGLLPAALGGNTLIRAATGGALGAGASGASILGEQFTDNQIRPGELTAPVGAGALIGGLVGALTKGHGAVKAGELPQVEAKPLAALAQPEAKPLLPPITQGSEMLNFMPGGNTLPDITMSPLGEQINALGRPGHITGSYGERFKVQFDDGTRGLVPKVSLNQDAGFMPMRSPIQPLTGEALAQPWREAADYQQALRERAPLNAPQEQTLTTATQPQLEAPLVRPEAMPARPAPLPVDENGYVVRDAVQVPSSVPEQTFKTRAAAQRAIGNQGLDPAVNAPVQVGKKQWMIHNKEGGTPYEGQIQTEGQGQKASLLTPQAPLPDNVIPFKSPSVDANALLDQAQQSGRVVSTGQGEAFQSSVDPALSGLMKPDPNMVTFREAHDKIAQSQPDKLPLFQRFMQGGMNGQQVLMDYNARVRSNGKEFFPTPEAAQAAIDAHIQANPTDKVTAPYPIETSTKGGKPKTVYVADARGSRQVDAFGVQVKKDATGRENIFLLGYNHGSTLAGENKVRSYRIDRLHETAEGFDTSKIGDGSPYSNTIMSGFDNAVTKVKQYLPEDMLNRYLNGDNDRKFQKTLKTYLDSIPPGEQKQLIEDLKTICQIKT